MKTATPIWDAMTAKHGDPLAKPAKPTVAKPKQRPAKGTKPAAKKGA